MASGGRRQPKRGAPDATSGKAVDPPLNEVSLVAEGAVCCARRRAPERFVFRERDKAIGERLAPRFGVRALA